MPYNPFHDKSYNHSMPILKKAGLIPNDTRWEMELRVDAWDKFQAGEIDETQLLAIWGNHQYTGDGLVRMTSGGAKIKVASPNLLQITQNTPLSNFGISHTADPYPDIAEISPRTIKKDFNRHLRQGEPQVHEGWLALAHGDDRLVKTYDEALRGLRKMKGYDPELSTGLFIHDATDVNVERAVALDSFLNYRGGAVGDVLNYYDARLAGLAPEALERRVIG